ncbi:MAG: ABC transporter ATP-binding protein/permease [Methylococcales bacterium]|nr:ABC transporter ATP-binding protein/permease [Methylococcales bacterium]
MPIQNGFLLQFIQLAGPFWQSENKKKIRQLTLALFALTVIQIIVAVVITEWSANLFNALERRSMSGVLTQVGYIILIFIANIAVTVTHFKVKRELQLDWRNWLTTKLIAQWMNDGRHYLVTHIQNENSHDNPDGRIAEDIRIATESAIDLIHSLIFSLLLLVSFSKILWTLSGVVTLDLWLVEIPIYGHLVWLALLYATGASILGWWIGRPLTTATNGRQNVEANFRFGLVNARENSLAISLIHGEDTERQRCYGLFNEIVEAWQRQTTAWAHIFMFTSGHSVLLMAFPILVSAPRFVWGSISLGGLMQSAQAFQQMTSALSWPVDNMAKIAEWRASVERVLSLVHALDTLEQEMTHRDPHRIQRIKTEQSILKLKDLCIMRLDGVVCLHKMDIEIKAGERILVSGNVFSGSKLFKAIVGFWPWGEGKIELPNDEICFVPPRPYLPMGTLRAAICYPLPVSDVNQMELQEKLEAVGLNELSENLDNSDSWDTALSREQQQRLGAVRLLLQQPKWILLQQAFDSLDSDEEIAIMRLICQELPKSAILTITHESRAEAFHQRKITLK